MRYLHPVAVHESFVASGVYKFLKDGEELKRTESWTIHEHPDGEQFIRVDEDSRFLDEKSLLLEALVNGDGQIERFDIRYENPKFENGIKTLRASYTYSDEGLQVGYNINGAKRQHETLKVPRDAIFDIPLCAFRGNTTIRMQSHDAEMVLFAPMFEYFQLFPGVITHGKSPVEFVTEEIVAMGQKAIPTRRYRYPDNAISYWIDEHDIMIKRVNAYKQQEFVAYLTNYAHR